MYVVSVAPIKRGIPLEELSYFSKEMVNPGTLVTIPIRKRLTHGLVLRCVLAETMKSEIKRADFSIKKLEEVHRKNVFRKEFIDACSEIANHVASTTGAVVHALFPTALLLSKKISHESEVPLAQKRHRIQSILQAEEKERLATYKSHIREVFARGKSCYFVLPSIQDIEHIYESIEKGIQEYTFILHGGLTKKELELRFEQVLTMKHPVLIIGTPMFLSVPRYDIESIILDRESGGAYMQQTRPYIDMRMFVEIFSKLIGADLILGDLFLRVETLFRHEQKEFESMLRPKSRLPSTARCRIIDMRQLNEQPATGRVAIASPELVDLIEDVRQKGTHCFIMGVRRGFAPMTVCGDCATVVTCTACSAPMVIHKKHTTQKETIHVFLCHRCGKEEDTDRNCIHCGGWRLIPLGIGVEQAYESLRMRFPDAHIFRLDKDSAKKHSEALAIIKEFYHTPGSILIGTEMAIPYLTEPVSSVGVLSVNSLLTMPDFRMNERVFRLLITLREKAREEFLIQTREKEKDIFELATNGNIGEFLRSELDARKMLNYPPYATLIKFTFEGTKADGERIMNDIEQLFSVYLPVTFPSFISYVKGKYRINALLRIPKKDKEITWPNNELLSLIRSLPLDIEVRINPESVI